MEMSGRENVNGAKQSLNALPGGSNRVMRRESCCLMALGSGARHQPRRASTGG